MSNPIVVITNNSKKIGIDITRENKTKYRINSNDFENTGDNYINIKFFLNTDYLYNSTDNFLVVVSSYSNDQVVRNEEFIFKLEDIFFDKLINLNTDYITIFFDNSGFFDISGELILDPPITFANIYGNITQIKIPLVSRIYGSSNVPIKTDIFGRIDISGQQVDISGQRVIADISGQRIDISGQRVIADISGQRIDISGQRIDISGQRIDISGQRIDISGQRVLSNIYDWQNNGITSTNHTVFKYGLDTTSALATTDMTNRYLLTSTSDGGSKRGLDVNIASGTVSIDTSTPIPVSGTFFQETQPVSIDTSTPIPVTGDIIIDNGSTTNFNSATGLNVYQILPKIKMYTIGGFDEQNSTYRLFGLATPGGINTTTTNFGLANPRVHYGGTSGGTDRVAYIDYVNSSGDLIENAGPYTFNSVTYATLPNMIAPIKFRLTTNLAAGQAVYISIAANSSVSAVAGEDQNQYCIGTFTVPNGYIGYISHLNSNVSATTNIQIVKWNVDGIRSVVYRFNNTGNANHTAGYEGGLGGIFYAGETVAFSNQSTAAGKSCFANMILKSIL